MQELEVESKVLFILYPKLSPKELDEVPRGWLQYQGTCLRVTWWPVKGPGMSLPSRELPKELRFGIFTRSPELKVHLSATLFTSYCISSSQLTHVLAGKILEWNLP